MPDLETLFAQALEPLVIELEAVRAELATLKAHQLDAPTIEPLVIELEAMRAELATLAQRFDAPAWAPGVYRQGVVVQHFHGQYFEALADTAIEPGDGVAWRRLGLHGFRYRGLFVEGADYEAGDLVARDGGMMLQSAGSLRWLVIRGKTGKNAPRLELVGGAP